MGRRKKGRGLAHSKLRGCRYTGEVSPYSGGPPSEMKQSKLGTTSVKLNYRRGEVRVKGGFQDTISDRTAVERVKTSRHYYP